MVNGSNSQGQMRRRRRRRRRRRHLPLRAPTRLGLLLLLLVWAVSSLSGTAGHAAEDPHVRSSHIPHNNSSSYSSSGDAGISDSTRSSHPSASPRSRSVTTTRRSGTTTALGPISSVTAAIALPFTHVLKPGASLADRCADVLGIRKEHISPAVSDMDHTSRRQQRPSLSHDFLQRLRHEEEEVLRESERQQQRHSPSLTFATAPRRQLFSALWSQTVSSSLLLLLASVLLELDWNQLGQELHRASIVAVSILWLPWFWIRPDQWRWADAFVYLPLLVRPSILAHVWHTVLVPYTGPTLGKMMVAEAWSIVWKAALVPWLPQFPKHTDTWSDALLVGIGQTLHKGTLKLFTSRVQQHLHSACAVVWNKGIERLFNWSVRIADAHSKLMGTK